MPLTYDDLKHEYRLMHDGDEWGNCLSWWFAVAGEMYERGLDIPPEWQYRPSPFGGREEGLYETDVCLEASDEALELFGRVLCRLGERLKACGRDY